MKTYLCCVVSVIYHSIMFWLVTPTLISAESDVGFGLGVILLSTIPLSIYGTYKLIKYVNNSKTKTKEIEVNE